jgi:hypothetical protein
MSAARSAKGAKSNPAKTTMANAPAGTTFTLPSLSTMLAPVLNATNSTANAPCNCGCCQTSTTVCLTFDTTWLQNLVNMFPKVNITNNNSCMPNDCGCEDDNEPGK